MNPEAKEFVPTFTRVVFHCPPLTVPIRNAFLCSIYNRPCPGPKLFKF